MSSKPLINSIHIKKIKIDEKNKVRDEDLIIGSLKKVETVSDQERLIGVMKDKERNDTTAAPNLSITVANRLAPKFEYSALNSKTSVQEDKPLFPPGNQQNLSSVMAADHFIFEGLNTERDLGHQFAAGDKEVRSPARALTEKEKEQESHRAAFRLKALSISQNLMVGNHLRPPDPSNVSNAEVLEEQILSPHSECKISQI